MSNSTDSQGLVGQLQKASDQMKRDAPEALQAAAVGLSEIVHAQDANSELKRQALLLRTKCQQRLALFSSHLDEVLAFHESALGDLRAAVEVDRTWFARQMARRWFPEHPAYIPAYIEFFTLRSEQLDFVLGDAARAIGEMGLEGEAARPALEALHRRWPSIPFVESSLRRISAHGQTPNLNDDVLVRIEEELQIYPGQQDRFDLEHPLSEWDLRYAEPELAALLADENWAVRAKAACILRCTVDKPQPETFRSLLDHLGASEKRGNVRGQCALTLAHFASLGRIKDQALELVIGRLRERLEGDPAYAVKAIAAQCLSRIAPDQPNVVAALTSALSTTSNENFGRALVQAVGECGPAAVQALPLVLRFKPHRLDDSGDVVRAAAIISLAPADHPAARKALNEFCTAMWQSFGDSSGMVRQRNALRERRETALKSIRRLPMDALLLRKLLLQRLSFDDCARLRCEAANVLIDIDKDLAKKVGAYRFISRIARQRP